MATPAENKAAAEKRASDNRVLAEKARAAGDLKKADMYEQRAEAADASADRYARLVDAKTRIDTAKKNIETIKENLAKSQQSGNEITSGPNKGFYAITTSRPSAACPSGHERVYIEYMNGVETKVTSLGCIDSSPSGATDSESSTPAVSPVPPKPIINNASSPTPSSPPPPPVKTAPIDTILFDDDSTPIETMLDLIFEDIGGQELINVARNDTINGQNIVYNPIKNATILYQEYNPNNILALQATSDKYFANYPIKLENKIPNFGNGENNTNYYIDENSGDLIIETINMLPDEQIEIQITSGGTIYEVTL